MATVRKDKFFLGPKWDWENMIRLGTSDKHELVLGDFDKLSGHDWDAYDFVVPLRIADYPALWRAGDRLDGKALYPTAAAVDLCHDKHAFARTLSRSSYHALIPRLIEDGEPVEFPCILKKRHDAWGCFSTIIHGVDDISMQCKKIQSGEYFLQEYIHGSGENACHILLRDGQIVYSLHVSHDVADQPYVKGKWQDGRMTTVGTENPFLAEFQDILKLIGYRDGTCCVDYKISNGTPKIFEINPRCGASLFYDVDSYLKAYRDAARGRSGSCNVGDGRPGQGQLGRGHPGGHGHGGQEARL